MDTRSLGRPKAPPRVATSTRRATARRPGLRRGRRMPALPQPAPRCGHAWLATGELGCEAIRWAAYRYAMQAQPSSVALDKEDLELLADAQAGVPAFVPADALVRGDRGLEAGEELVGAGPGLASLEIDDVHGRAMNDRRSIHRSGVEGGVRSTLLDSS